MAAANHNFFIEQGSNFELVFEYLDENGNPITINNSDCVRLKTKDNNNIYRVWRNAATTNGSLLTRSEDTTLAANQIKFSLPASITRSFNFDTAIYVLDLVIGGIPENTIKLSTGQISIISDLFIEECLDGVVGPDFQTCIDCTSISPEFAVGIPSNVTATPQEVTPTPTPSIGAAPTPTPSSNVFIQEDLCDYLCRGLDIFAQIYTGNQITISDASILGGVNTPSASSGLINVANTGVAKNIELYIDNLVHDNPSDLTMILTPPSGSGVLLSSRNKINNYNKQTGLKFAFSNKALPETYLNNKSNNNDLFVNILQNTGVSLPSPYNNSYQYSFNHLFDAPAGALSGNWGLHFIDHDSGGSGYINSWNLVITYAPEPYNENL
jgi:subtilisin-like proprotein convertase family protein